MTDLTGPDLALAVARVMGLKTRTYHGRVQFLEHVQGPLAWHDFNPMTNGHDFKTVHDWVRAQGAVVAYRPNAQRGGVSVTIRPDPDDWQSVEGLGPDDATALCRAVVALGDYQGSKPG